MDRRWPPDLTINRVGIIHSLPFSLDPVVGTHEQMVVNLSGFTYLDGTGTTISASENKSSMNFLRYICTRAYERVQLLGPVLRGAPDPEKMNETCVEANGMTNGYHRLLGEHRGERLSHLLETGYLRTQLPPTPGCTRGERVEPYLPQFRKYIHQSREGGEHVFSQ